MKSNKRQYAILAGTSLLLMTVAAGYAYGFVYSNLVNHEDPSATLLNIQSATDTFTGGVAGWVTILILDLLVSWAVYKFFQDLNKRLAVITSGARFLYSGILALAIFQLFRVILVADEASADEVMALLGSFETIWSLGLIVFGVHLVGLGKLALEAANISKVFGWLLLIAGLCYFSLHSAKALFPAYQEQIVTVEIILSLPMAIGELAFAAWLLIKGGKTKKEIP